MTTSIVDKEWKLFLEYKNRNDCFDQYNKDIYSIFEHSNKLNTETSKDTTPVIDDSKDKEILDVNVSSSSEIESCSTGQTDIHSSAQVDIKKEKAKTKKTSSKKSKKEKDDNTDNTLKEKSGKTDKDEVDDLNDLKEDDEEDEDDDELLDNKEIDNKDKVMELYISTQTKIAFLNKKIDVYDVYWKIPLIHYDDNNVGIIKKQVIYKLSSEKELEELVNKYNTYEEKGYTVDDHIIKNIINPNGRIKYKSVRKISIGLSKKDLNGKKNKKKGAFFNCFVLILKYNENDDTDTQTINLPPKYNEYHIKIFNTGKIEIPGIQKSSTFNKILELLISILKPLIISDDNDILSYSENKEEMVIINSNFYCGFEINREKLYEILKNKYNLQVIYDSCSYPGIKCRFYYNIKLPENEQNGVYYSNTISTKSLEIKKHCLKISFMIFRTGKILIVGKCHEGILRTCFEFLCKLLTTEYDNISVKPITIC